MLHEFSLTAKLAALALGDVVYLPDVPAKKGPSLMERSIAARVRKSPKLTGRIFRTVRMVAVTVNPAEARPILAIIREK